MDALISVGLLILLACQPEQSLADQPLYEIEAKLLKDLLSDFDTSVLPIANVSKPVIVKFGIHLQNIHEVDETKGILHVAVWLNYEWKDERLRWNESEYGRIQTIRMPPTDIWIPDITPYNAAHPDSYIAMEEATNVVVYSSGSVSWVPIVNLQTSCSMDLTNFPFDTQVCEIKFGSWTNNGEKIDLYTMWNEIDVSSFKLHASWELVSTNGTRNVQIYECCPEPYIDVTFEMTLKRRAACFTYLYVWPYTLLALAIPFIFLLSYSGPHRCIFAGAIIIAMVILIGNLEWNVSGHGKKTPKLSIFYIASFVVAVLAMILANLVMSLAAKARGKSSPPLFLTKVFSFVPSRMLCCMEGSSGNLEILRSESTEEQNDWLKIAGALDIVLFIAFLILIVLMAMITLIH